MISQTAEYALRAIVFLADNPHQAHTAELIAGGTKVPFGYLAKVLQMLSRAKLVTSQRGLHGGFTLARKPSALTVLEVIQAIEPVSRIHTCPLGINEHGSNLCPLHRHLDACMERIETTLKDLTILTLISDPLASHPLCSTPPVVARPTTGR